MNVPGSSGKNVVNSTGIDAHIGADEAAFPLSGKAA